MSHEKQQVRKFYEVIWNKHNKDAVPEILHSSFKFRGSLGSEKQGHAGFIEYLDMVHAVNRPGFSRRLRALQCNCNGGRHEWEAIYRRIQDRGGAPGHGS
ncbi:nuclear transport factor 2 family protein, partial [Thiohalobacter sp.]|uniref:nuclear transport factor 2 family protein n=1 Tax=Thiohalobacter sp. TaxID=2025948 RepID=UPI0039839A6B